MGVLESQLSSKFSTISQLSAKFSAISQLSVNFDKSQLLFFWPNAKWFRNHLCIILERLKQAEVTTVSTSFSPS